jgi:GNAT superfamily N-acetyltransferase
MATDQAIRVRITDWADAVGADLRAQQLQEIAADIEGESVDGAAPSADDVKAVFILEIKGIAVACASLREIPDDAERAAEVKRMFVLPQYRGSAAGVTTRLMAEVEGEARRKGYRTLRLATGVGMHRARAFYEKHGFSECHLFWPYSETVSTACYSKKLV